MPTASAPAPDLLAPVKVVGSAFVGIEGGLLFGSFYADCREFSEGFAPVKIRDKWGFIDRTGKLVCEPLFDEAWPFSNGLAVVRAGEYMGAVDHSFNKAVPIQFKELDSFVDGLAAFADRTGHYGFVSSTGRFVASARYAQVQRYSEGMAAAQLETEPGIGLWGYLDRSGTMIIPPDYYDAREFSEGLAAVSDGQYWGYINAQGKVIVPFVFELAWPFQEGLAAVKCGEKWGYINTGGEFAIEPQWDYAEPFRDGLAKVAVKGRDMRYGFTTTKGELVIPVVLEDALGFNGETTAGRNNNLWGLVNKSNFIVANFDYDQLIPLKDGNYLVRFIDRWGVLAPDGTLLTYPDFINLQAGGDGLLIAQFDGWGLATTDGAMAVRPFFAEIRQDYESIAVKVGNVWGNITASGSFTIEPAYVSPIQFAEGYAAISPQRGWVTYLDELGQEVFTDRLSSSGEVCGGNAPVRRMNGMAVYNVKAGKYVLEKLTDALCFPSGAVAVGRNSGYELITPDGKSVPITGEPGAVGTHVALLSAGMRLSIPTVGLFVTDSFPRRFYSEGLLAIQVRSMKDAIGFIDESGYFVIAPQFLFVRPFSEGLAAVRTAKGWGYTDRQGNIVIEPGYTQAGGFSSGYAPVRSNREDGSSFCFYIDKTGSRAFDRDFDLASVFNGGAASVQIQGAWRVFTVSGELVGPDFDSLGEFLEGWAPAELDGRKGFVDASGNFRGSAQFTEVGRLFKPRRKENP